MKHTNQVFLSLVRDGIRIGKAAGQTAEAVAAMTTPQLEEVLALARLHHLGPMVGAVLSSASSDQTFSRSLRREVLSVGAETARKEVALSALTKALTGAGIPYALVKGAALRVLYPEPELRISSDEDILVENFGPAEEIFAAQGFRKASSGTFVHTWIKDSLCIELHSSLLEGWEFQGVDSEIFDGCLKSRCQFRAAWGSAYTLAPQEHFLYLIVHFYKHFLSGGIGLRQVCDILLFAEKQKESLNFPEIWAFLKGARLDVLFRSLLEIGERYLAMPPCISVPQGIPAPGCEDLLDDILAAGAYGSSTMERKRSSRMTIAAAESGKASSGGAIHALFPSRKSLAGQYPYLNRHPWLLPAAWGSRIFTYLRSGGGKGAGASAEIGKARVALLQKYGILDNNR